MTDFLISFIYKISLVIIKKGKLGCSKKKKKTNKLLLCLGLGLVARPSQNSSAALKTAATNYQIGLAQYVCPAGRCGAH